MRYLWLALVGISLLTLTACFGNRLERNLETPTAEEAVVVAPTPDPDGLDLQPQLGNANINLEEVQTLLPPDAIPAILPDEVDDILVSAEAADANGMDPATRVLGISINGESRAYPVPYMSSHEIVNDEVGGTLVAATW